MVCSGTGILYFVRSFLVFCLAVLLIGSIAFVGGTTPASAVPSQVLNDEEGTEDETPESDTSPELEPQESDAATESPGQTEEPSTNGESPDSEGTLLPEEPTQGPSGADALRRQLNQLNSALSPLAAGDTCNHANPGTGAYAETLCWLDFNGFTMEYYNFGTLLNPNWQSVMGSQYTAGGRSGDWGNIQNYPVSVNLGGGYVLTAQLDATGNNNRGKRVASASFPTWSGAFLGNNNFYTGVDGNPALYQQAGRGDTLLTLKNVELRKNGVQVYDYSVVVADAETTDSGEGIEWSTTGKGFTWLPNETQPRSKSDVMGNACTTATPAWNSTTPARTASCFSNSSAAKTGTPMLATAPPNNGSFQITQRMITPTGLNFLDRQGVAFGVIVGRAEIQAEVEERIVDQSNQNTDATNFSAVISQETANTEVVRTQTGTSALTSPLSSQMIPVSSTGTQLRLSSTATGTVASSYTPAWSCEKSDPQTGLTTYWPSQGTTSSSPPSNTSTFTQLKVGQILRCDVLYSPPYLSLEKEVNNAETGANHTSADFTVQASGQGSGASVISGPGNQAASVTRRPVAKGEYSLDEIAPDPEVEGNWEFGYDWSEISCVPGGDSTPVEDVTTSTDEEQNITQASLMVAAGNDITCTFHNTARLQELQTSKEVFDAEGAPVDWNSPVAEGESLSYRLTFDNSGTITSEIDYRDYLSDVLDDSTFVDGSVRISDGTESSYPESIPDPGITVTEDLNEPNPQLLITGTIPRGQVRTVWFQVDVLQNSDNSEERQNDSSNAPEAPTDRVGYVLNNYLLHADESFPQTCSEPVEGEETNCTRNPVPAWSVEKDSRPADGARLHKGGNTHYQIIARKLNSATTITDLEFEDDLTHVFKTAGWAPGAAVPGGALQRGIYFFDAEDQSLDAEGNPIGSVATPDAAYDESSGYVPEPVLENGRWILRSEPVTLPENAVRAEMWFAVEAGNRPANIPPNWPGDSEPSFGSKYVNYVRSQAGNGLAPNQCGVGTTPVPDTAAAATDTNPVDEQFPEECRVMHQMSDNYFTIRKDARGAGIEFPSSVSGWGDGTGLTNMVGHEFEIRDDAGGQPSEAPSAKLCRAEYHPSTWNGEFISGGTPDWGENSETLAAIIDHNNGLPTGATELPLCGLFYPQGTYGGQEHAGGQDGRWRSEYLTEGDYWLVETKAPDHQINNSGTADREVPGVQLLAQPIAFKVWPEADAPFFGPQNPQQSMEGRGQLDVVGLEQQRCSPGAPVGERPIACVNPTGYLMLVQDIVPISMPFTGGSGTTWLTSMGAGILLTTSVGVWFWRRNRALNSIGGANPM